MLNFLMIPCIKNIKKLKKCERLILMDIQNILFGKTPVSLKGLFFPNTESFLDQ